MDAMPVAIPALPTQPEATAQAPPRPLLAVTLQKDQRDTLGHFQ